MEYEIHIKNPERQYLQISIKINTQGQEKIQLDLASWRPGRYELGNFAKNLRNFQAKNELSEVLNYTKTSKDSWLVDTKNCKTINIYYEYYASELNAGSTYLDPEQLYVNPINCLLYCHDKLENSCTLQLFVPENYQIACARPQKEKNQLHANTIHELFDSPLIASANLRHHSFEVQAHTFHVWAQGGEMLDLEKIATDFQKFTSLQIADFGVFPSAAYHFLLQISPQKAYHGVEHTDSTVIHLGPSTEVMQSLYKELLGICSHELYHVWNIKTLRPKAMLPYNYKAENYTDLTAIAEGITTYLGDWYLYKSGLITLQEFQNELAEHVQKHFDQGAYLYNSLGESAWDTWLDGYTTGVPQRKLSIYSDGALLAFICDARIRKHSANSKTLCDAMRLLYENCTETGYTLEDFQHALQETAGISFADIFREIYWGKNPYTKHLAEAFDAFHWQWQKTESTVHYEKYLGIELKNLRVEKIFPTAQNSPFMLGDIIFACNDMIFANEQDLDIFMAQTHCNTWNFQINRKGKMQMINAKKSSVFLKELHKIST
jgi:predicted metalloprotease with PDZ domain